MTTKYLSCAETAKLLRLALKESFPKQKFSVVSHVYAGGASNRVKWFDGPSAKAVEAVTGVFEGAYFDGMTDYKGSKYHTLDGEPVSFGADFIFEERKIGKALAEQIAAKLGTKGWPCEIKGEEKWGYWFDGPTGSRNIPPYAVAEAEAELAGTVVAKESATLKRIAFTGDDGYGYGTVGIPGKTEGEQAAKACSAAQDRKVAEAAEEAADVALIQKIALAVVTGQAHVAPAVLQ